MIWKSVAFSNFTTDLTYRLQLHKINFDMRQNIVVFSGAGISRESGLATYRDPDGIWSGYNPDIVATPQGFDAEPAVSLQFYNELRKAVYDASPNHAHMALASLEKEHDVTIITQNIDDLHERAGSSRVLHLHGELKKVTSSDNRLDEKCIMELPLDIPIKIGDKAHDGSQLRPYVVMFGEYLTTMNEAVRIVKEADIFVIVGTSLTVFPANQLAGYAHPEVPRFVIDPNDVDVPEGFVHIKQPASKGIDCFLRKLNELLYD